MEVEVETQPEQPDEVVAAIARLLAAAAQPPEADAWWRLGLDQPVDT